jgi:amino acid transporter
MASPIDRDLADRIGRTRAAIDAAVPVEGLDPKSPVHQLDRRRLPPAVAVTQSLGSIAPAAVASAAPAAAIAAAGGASAIIGAVIALLVAAAVARSVNVYTKRLTAPGSLYTFAVHGLGQRPGALVGAALMLGYAAIAAACAVGAAHYFSELFDVQGRLVLASVTLLIAVAAAASTAIGTRATWPVLLAAEGLSIAMVVSASVVLLVTAVTDGPPPVQPTPVHSTPDAFAIVALVTAVAIATSGFVGFESGTALGPETRRPFRVVPRVVRWTPLVSGAVLVLATTAQAATQAATGLDLGATSSPLPDLLTVGHSPMWRGALDIAIGLSFAVGAVASLTALIRLLFALGLDRMLPSFVTRVHPRRRTPTGALAAALPLIAGVPIIAILSGAPVRPLMEGLIAAGVLGYMFAYLGVSVAAPGFLRRIGERRRRDVASAATTSIALGVLILVYGAYQVMNGSALPVVAVVAVGAAAALATNWSLSKRPRDAPRLGTFDETSAEDVFEVAVDRPPSGT